MSIEWYDVVGFLGVLLVLIAYYLLQVGRLDPHGLAYSVVNLAGAGLITVSLLFEFNFSAFLIEICWIAISAMGVARAWRTVRADGAPPPAA
jgi:hypothetical protein